MLKLIAVHSNSEIHIRQKFSVIEARLHDDLRLLLNFSKEAVIINTCNRTEIYLNTEINKEHLIIKVFKALNWDISLKEHIFYKEAETVINHLMEVTCGFQSKILGEDQILSQVKFAYEESLKLNAAQGELQRLFQYAITCGKEFKSSCEICKIPVSFSSIITKEAYGRGIKRFMLLGYGDTGSLTTEYLLAGDLEVLYVVVRDLKKYSYVKDVDKRIVLVLFPDRHKYYSDVDCIISCTSAPHTVVHSAELPDKQMLIYDLAVPKDVDDDVANNNKFEIKDIDSITLIDAENKVKRYEKMQDYHYIIDKYVEGYTNWLKVKEVSTDIKELVSYGNSVYLDRYNTYKNKDSHRHKNGDLVEVLLKSTSDAYVNKAIEVLKEEIKEGRGEECLRILKRIFQD